MVQRKIILTVTIRFDLSFHEYFRTMAHIVVVGDAARFTELAQERNEQVDAFIVRLAKKCHTEFGGPDKQVTIDTCLFKDFPPGLMEPRDAIRLRELMSMAIATEEDPSSANAKLFTRFFVHRNS